MPSEWTDRTKKIRIFHFFSSVSVEVPAFSFMTWMASSSCLRLSHRTMQLELLEAVSMLWNFTIYGNISEKVGAARWQFTMVANVVFAYMVQNQLCIYGKYKTNCSSTKLCRISHYIVLIKKNSVLNLNSLLTVCVW